MDRVAGRVGDQVQMKPAQQEAALRGFAIHKGLWITGLIAGTIGA